MGGKHSSEEARAITPQLWLELHGDYLFRYALARLHDRDVAEDMVQETFLAGLKAKERFNAEASERTWLVGIMKHKIIDYFRKSSREVLISNPVTQDDASEDLFDKKGKWAVKPAPWGSDPGAVMHQKQFWKIFLACLSELPKHMARIFSLREMEGLKGQEICDVMKISPSNLGVILYRARMRLRRCLETNWLENQAEGR